MAVVYLGSSISSPVYAGRLLAVILAVLMPSTRGTIARWFPVLWCCCDGWWCWWYGYAFFLTRDGWL